MITLHLFGTILSLTFLIIVIGTGIKEDLQIPKYLLFVLLACLLVAINISILIYHL